MKFTKAFAGSALGFALSMAAGSAWAETDLTKLLPQSIQDTRTLNVIASSSGSPPMNFLGADARTLEGLEIDLTNAVAEALGVKIEFMQGTFDSLIPAIAAGRADFAVGSIGDLKSRQEQVDFVDYVKAGVGMAVLKGNPKDITDLASLCGKTVAVVRGTFQEKELAEQQEKCKAQGSTLDVQTFAETNAAVLALRSERADAWSGDSAPVGYAISQAPDTIELAGELRIIALLGYAVGKENTQLRDAIKAALEELHSNGKYQEIFAKWGQQNTMVDKISVNDAWL